MRSFNHRAGASRGRSSLLGLAAVAALTSPTLAQLRVAAWNVTNYSGGRVADFQTAFYGVYQDQTFAPDCILGSEFMSQSAVNTFVSLLNAAPGSPGDWQAGQFIDGPDTDSAFFYRTSRVQLLAVVLAAPADPGTTGQPRHTMRYDIRPVGYTAAETTIACYDVHLKAGTSSGDAPRRLIEANRIRANAQALPAGWHFLVGGDFNMRTATEGAYQAFVGGSLPGRFYDPIATPGSWYNNSGFRFVHTQAPGGAAGTAGGMDDRHDQLLISAGLIDGDGLDYIGNPAIPYSATTWDDPNHSYRCWGNDGSSFNQTITIAGNTMVGPVIAQALYNSATGGGHLPVFLDVRLPALASAETAIDFGQVAVGSVAEQTLHVSNSADTVLWTAAGLDDLVYSMTTNAGFTAPAGSFLAAPGTPAADHTIAMDTSVPGVVSGTITIATNSPETPVLTVTLTGEITSAPDCVADLNEDGFVDYADYLEFLNLFDAADLRVDFNMDGFVDYADYLEFLNLYEAGC